MFDMLLKPIGGTVLQKLSLNHFNILQYIQHNMNNSDMV